MQHYTNFESTHHPVQSPLPGQIKNNAGGMSWQVDPMTGLYRFLILGTIGGTYYVGEQDLLKQNLSAVKDLLDAGQGMMVVDAVVDVSTKGRAPSNDPALLVLAMCASCNAHGKVKRWLPIKRQYVLHREHHEELFQKFSLEGIPVSHTKNGRKETFMRKGDLLYRTIEVPEGTFIEEDQPGNLAVRQYALSQLPKVARTGTHRLHFFQFVRKFRGTGSMLRKAMQHLYIDCPEQHLARQLIKYQQRDGYSQSDILSLVHPKPPTETYNALFHWVKKGWPGVGDDPHPDPALRHIWVFERAKHIQDEQEMALLVKEYRLSREMIPTHFLTSKTVYEAILHSTPPEGMEGMVRNLGNMTRIGLLAPENEHTQYVVRMLTDPIAVKKSRIHPIRILAALTQYELGHGEHGGYQGKGITRSSWTGDPKAWTAVPEIMEALDKAFRLAFVNVEATGKKILLAIDVSGSMTGSKCHGLKNLTLHQAAAAMAVILVGIEGSHNVATIAVDTRIYPLAITGDMPLHLVLDQISHHGGGGTNLGLAIEHALQNKRFFDCIIMLTDQETWQGRHPAIVLEEYRRKINPNARMINVQMEATHVTNNAPDDRRALEVAGFDTSVPEIIRSFIAGDI
jgi:60 kDa SS-A/Ro ribonucleoprotein